MAYSTPGSSGGESSNAAARNVLSVGDHNTVSLPDGVDLSSLDFTREGQDLVLKGPDGQTLVVEGYFSAADAPVILSPHGGMLSPALVQSFLKAGADVEVAANATANDASPVGEITEMSGHATVTHADGSRENVTNGTKIYEGDIVETDDKGAVNIKFVDDSTFAISENARLAVDDFSFNPSDQSGTTGLSILRGVFMFTSGLVGRENPDAVHLNTPVGSIGIRGTIIGGHISENGESQISVLEGAIVVRNGMGEQILSDQFETVKLTGFNAPITNVGTMEAAAVSQSYGAVRAVSPALFTSIDDAGHDAGAQPGQPGSQTQGEGGDQSQGDTKAEGQQSAAEQAATDAQPVFQSLQNGAQAEAAPPAAEPPAPPAAVAPAPAPAPPPPPPAPPATVTNTAPTPPAALVFTAGGHVAENAAAGTVVGTVAPSAQAAYGVTYSLVNNPDGRFTVNATTGEVRLVTAAGDYDQGVTGYNFVVRATRTDTGQFIDTALRAIVDNVDEAPQFNTGLASISTSEGAAIVLTQAMVGATDPEHAGVTYTLSGAAHGVIQTTPDGSTWTTVTQFTQAQLAAGYVRFLHDGSEPANATTFTLVASDATSHSSAPRNFTVTVSNVNDAPVITSGANVSVDENSTSVTTVTATDSDAGDVLTYSIIGGADASKFVINSSTGALGFLTPPDYETPTDAGANNVYNVTVRVSDGHGGTADQAVAVTVLDVGATATGIVVNEGMTYSGTYEALLQGNSAGAYIAMLEPLSAESSAYAAANYRITGITNGGAYVAGDFEIVDKTEDDGGTIQILKLKDNVAVDYTAQSMTITVELDVGKDGFGVGTDISKTITMLGRNDTMILEAVNGKNGFLVNNNSRFGGALMGVGLGAGDFNSDGSIDLVLSAPNAINGDATNPEHSGGIYAFSNTSTFPTNIQDGEILLSTVTSGGNGFFTEVATAGAGNDSDSFYGASLAVLGRFDGTAGSEIAVSNAGDNRIDIFRNGSLSSPSSITNLGVGASSAVEMAHAIKIAAIGDVNGDGYADMLVGTAYKDGGTYTNDGGAFVVFGNGSTSARTINAAALSTNGVVVDQNSAANNTYFGSSVAGLGDFNGDGIADFAVGARGVDTNAAAAGTEQGQVTIYFGSTSLTGSPDHITINGVADQGHLGWAIASGGDFNGDGLGDLMMQTGNSLYVVTGTSNPIVGDVNIDGSGSPDPDYNAFKIYTTDSSLQLGGTFGQAGDFNGDGYGDLFFDVRKDLGGGHYEHTLTVLYGKATPTDIDLATAMADPSQTYKIRLLGDSSEYITAASAGDFNGDGFSDLMIGVPQDGDADGDGQAYVVYGSNYDDTTSNFAGLDSAAANGQSFTGSATSDTLLANGYTDLSFRGGNGADVLEINNTASLRLYDGGQGSDTLTLGFSAEETSTAALDYIDLQGARNKVSGIETILFDTGSKLDVLKLDIRDIISLASSSETRELIIKASDASSGGEENSLMVKDNGSVVSDLYTLSSGLQFTNDADSNGQDTQIIDSRTFYQYTHVESGVTLLVDSRLAGAGILASG